MYKTRAKLYLRC